MKEDAAQLGPYLQYEREKSGISIEEIASQIKLSVTTLQNLEKSNYDELPGAIYIRGYIRAYCSAIGIDPAAALKLFSGQADTTSPIKAGGQSVAPVVNEKVQRITRVWGTILVLAVVSFALMDRWSERTDDLVPQQEVVTQDAAEDAVQEPADTAEEFQPTHEPPADDEADSDTASADDEADSDTASADDEDVKTPTGSPVLVNMTVATEGSSWVRVYTNEEDIIRDLLPDDYHKSFSAELPVHIELGDARNVRIWINGKQYDFTPYISNIHTAFFSLETLPESE